MNERIRELAEQSGLLGPTSRIGNSHEATEKFAELIVKECRVALHTMLRDQISRGHAYKLIEEHFGVKL
jgi:hypothetical protein